MCASFISFIISFLGLTAIFSGLSTPLLSQTLSPVEFFESRVRPVFVNNCFSCHAVTAMGGLEMTSRASLLRGGNLGPTVVPGHPDRSLLIQAVRHSHVRLKMPPQGKLQDDEIRDLVTWVRDGAVWPETTGVALPGRKGSRYVITPEQQNFWAFRPIQPPELPKVEHKSWAKSPIDLFILARLEARKLEAVKLADKLTLLRRAHFDLVGLPPSPEEVETFLHDRSPHAFAVVVDRLLASPRYGERWGRFWLDLARYSDDKLNSTKDEPYPSAFRYRDWVIEAFNEDMPYDLFSKAQLAGDLLQPAHDGKPIGGLGFYALSPEFQDDRVDATTRSFLALTVGCAQCHDHKFDPIPIEDFYALLGVFNSTQLKEHPLASEAEVEEYQEQEKGLQAEKDALAEFRATQRRQLVDALSAQISHYIRAVWKILGPSKQSFNLVAQEDSLDQETLERWVKYLDNTPRDHPFLDPWDDFLRRSALAEEVGDFADQVQSLATSIIRKKKEIDRKNSIRTRGKIRIEVGKTELLSLERDRYFFWRDLASEESFSAPAEFDNGILFYKEESIDRFLDGVWKEHIAVMQARIKELAAGMPAKYPFLHVISDISKPRNEHVHIRGNKNNLGEEVPRRFLTVLSTAEARPFTRGSGRLELAEAIADPKNPLTARVMVNRIWHYHFGQGIVRTLSNFGQMGDRPSHPELLDYLAHRFIENYWSVKAMHREIMLSTTYSLSAEYSERNHQVDPDNRLLWRYNARRLDAEALRDSMLYVSGNLDLAVGGPSSRLEDEANRRRTVYGFVSRRRLNTTLALFDFPNPNSSSPRRITTNIPLQGLFFLNSDFMMQQAAALALRLEKESGPDARAKIGRAYRLLFGRLPSAEEALLASRFFKDQPGAWAQYAQALFSSNEFLYLN